MSPEFWVWQSVADRRWYWRLVNERRVGLAAGRIHHTYQSAVDEIQEVGRLLGATINVTIRRIADPNARRSAS